MKYKFHFLIKIFSFVRHSGFKCSSRFKFFIVSLNYSLRQFYTSCILKIYMVTSKCWTNWLKMVCFPKCFLIYGLSEYFDCSLAYTTYTPINLCLCDQCNRFMRLMLLSIRMNIIFPPLIFINRNKTQKSIIIFIWTNTTVQCWQWFWLFLPWYSLLQVVLLFGHTTHWL